MHHDWLWLYPYDLYTELTQAQEEGKMISSTLEQRLRDFSEKDPKDFSDPAIQCQAAALLDETILLPTRDDYPFVEPSDLEGIKNLRPRSIPLLAVENDPKCHLDKIHGAWLGRIYGCYLGKPVEGLRHRKGETYVLEYFLKETNQWPLQGYVNLDYPDEVLDSFGIEKGWKDGPPFMPEDDDTNYTTAALAILEKRGRNFTPDDVATFWMSNIPILHTCTAERIAYRNFCCGIEPPASASFRNPYREWIGAQIRADAYGFAAPGNPELAAEYAWRDACLSHIKNGIYGAMWVAAMLAAAYVSSDIPGILRAGLAQIPNNCRLSSALQEVMQWHAYGISYEDAVHSITQKWDEHNFHHWCHTISNAQICALALLWGEGDYATTISRAVLPGFDTDCNGATVGSVMGMAYGAKALPELLVGRLNDNIKTGIHGYLDCRISEMSNRFAALSRSQGKE